MDADSSPVKFVLNKPVETSASVVVVDGGLAVGTHRFRLEVVDESGKRSAPAEVDILVSRARPIRRRTK